MPKLTADEIITQKHKRAYIQYGAARPGNPVAYAGQDAQYMAITGVSKSGAGGVNPRWVHDPRRPGKYRLLARNIDPPDLDSATLEIREKHGAIPRQLQSETCGITFYEVAGTCEDLSDFLAGWDDYVLVYSNGIVSGSKDLGDRVVMDSDEEIVDSMPMTLADIYPIGKLGFGAEAAALIDRAVADVVYGTPNACQCADPTDFIYAVTKPSGAGSPGLPSEVVYSTDGGDEWVEATITGIGATEEAVAIEIVGNQLLVLGLDAYFIAEINADTGVPGAFTKVTTGFVAAGSPVDLYVANPREVYFCGDGGYIYKSTDITAGVSVLNAGDATTQDLNRIHGVDEVIVAVGNAGAIVKSTNRGVTFATTTTTPTASLLQAIAVLDDRRYWVGTDTGFLYYTLDGGETWASKTPSGFGAGTVHDIVFVNDEVGFIAHSAAGPVARLFSTWNGGENWTNSRPRILNLPTFDHIYRIAVPDADTGIAANNVALGGLGGNGLDGILVLGVAARI